MRKNLLLLKDSLEHLKIKFINTWLQFSKIVYMDKLDNVTNKYNNASHSAIKVEPVDIKSSKYINSGKEINNKDPIFKFGDNVQNTKI